MTQAGSRVWFAECAQGRTAESVHLLPLPPPPLLPLFPAGEDDGYLMVYVTKPDGLSYMHIYDAATMDSTPVAEVSEAAQDHNTLSETRLVERGGAYVRAL